MVGLEFFFHFTARSVWSVTDDKDNYLFPLFLLLLSYFYLTYCFPIPFIALSYRHSSLHPLPYGNNSCISFLFYALPSVIPFSFLLFVCAFVIYLLISEWFVDILMSMKGSVSYLFESVNWALLTERLNFLFLLLLVALGGSWIYIQICVGLSKCVPVCESFDLLVVVKINMV
jgi:hypothetical protein